MRRYDDGTVTVHHGDCIQVMRTLPDGSIDAVVTDPPYGLEFMGKDWDKFRYSNTGPQHTDFKNLGALPTFSPNRRNQKCPACGKWAYDHPGRKCECGGWKQPAQLGYALGFQQWCTEWATEALRVLKPGGHLVAFGGTRTWHRLACAIEDAGFEIRDSIMWQHMEHVFCQCQAVPYNYARVPRQDLPGVRQDVAADDAVSVGEEQDLQPRVCCQADQQGAQVSAQAADCHGDGCVCGVRQAGQEVAVACGEGPDADVLVQVQRRAARAGVGQARGQGSLGMDGCEQGVSDGEDERGEEPGMEGGGHLPQGQGQLRRREVCTVTEVGAPNGPQGRLHHGAPSGDGADVRATTDEDGSGQSHQPQPQGQPTGEPGTLAGQRIPQTRRGWPLCDWCSKPLAPPVDAGPLVWEYGSGFPKSLDVSKAIDKAAGATREVVGQREVWGRGVERFTDIGEDIPVNGNASVDITAPATDAARQWQGWGTALKPAYEPIVLARKPLTGTVAANVLAHGTGAINIDATRVNPGETVPGGGGLRGGAATRHEGWQRQSHIDGDPTQPHNAGRWPANVILDADAAAILDAQSGVSRDGVTVNRNKVDGVVRDRGTFHMPSKSGADVTYGGEGGASRFFYTSKAGRDERPTADGVAHPTVKPLDLMRWLVRLVTPPGGVVLDPFAGSGTTAEACIVEGFRCIAIELTDDYLPLIVARLSKPIQPTLGAM